MMSERQAAETFGAWLSDKVIQEARGRDVVEAELDPSSRFWLGTLAPEEGQLTRGIGERGERLDPSAVGIRVQPVGPAPWTFDVVVRCATWTSDGSMWRKSPYCEVGGLLEIRDGVTDHFGGRLATELERTSGCPDLSAVVRAEVVETLDGPSVELTVVNTSPARIRGVSSNLFEVELSVTPPAITPYLLESLPDSYRYDRRVMCYGINAGIEALDDGRLRTVDAIETRQYRPTFWNAESACPELSFASLADDPLPALHELARAHRAWGDVHWSDEALGERARIQGWTDEVREAALSGRRDYEQEAERLAAGVAALQANENLLRAFCLMNQAMVHSSRGRYPGWRPFQLAFVIACCPAVADPTAEAMTADVVWFATGGGKTETYLGLVVMAALYDRATGKTTGVTAWSRFPLRLLSLQQTQRFADAMAGAELVRQSAEIPGEPISLGFLIGAGATPNRLDPDPAEDWMPDTEDPNMPGRYRVLLQCPFCFGDEIEMDFDPELWRLDHRCSNTDCPWGDRPLPFYVVDDEIYRFLPTAVIGTLDKIASLSIQAAMAGLFGPPAGICSEPGHGHTYARRKKKPQGCLVPGCDRSVDPLPMPEHRYAPTFRLQDELHLLRDALGAVDAHYEALLDHLQLERTGTSAKILGSSATLSGYEHQVDVLYRRQARVFPVQGPSTDVGFWTAPSEELSRRHIALAPRGATLEFANDRIVTILQQQLRRLRDDPAVVCAEAGVDLDHADRLLDLFGTAVVYGNTIRDLEAASRSLETQVPVDGPLIRRSLTGQTPFEEVRETLDQLQHPQADYDERIHVITASSMMSHGVDVDRLNTMVVLGLPLTTAEYIQTTARIGRTWPGFVFVLHKMARERDASTYRSWPQFVSQGDRFVEPVPVTKRSVRVLDNTMPGIMMARLLHLHEHRWRRGLTMIKALKEYDQAFPFDVDEEASAVAELLGVTDELDSNIRAKIRDWIEQFLFNLEVPPEGAIFPSELSPGGRRPMLSLRDVEETAPIREKLEGRR